MSQDSLPYEFDPPPEAALSFLEAEPVYLVFSCKLAIPELVAEFDRVLQSMKSDGAMDDILQKYLSE